VPSRSQQVDELPTLEDYGGFLHRYTPFNAPFLHEARVHLNRRDHYLTSADRYRQRDVAEFQRRMTIAHYENRNLEKYFPETLLQSGFKLADDTVKQMKAYASTANRYESAVSKALITRVNERQVLWATLILATALMVLDRLLKVRRRA
jgi:hypothetical protein